MSKLKFCLGGKSKRPKLGTGTEPVFKRLRTPGIDSEEPIPPAT